MKVAIRRWNLGAFSHIKGYYRRVKR